MVNLGVAMSAAMGATLIKMPFDVSKSRIQNQLQGVNGDVEFRNVAQTIWRTWEQEGFFALYKGLGPTAARMVIGQSVAYAAFELSLDFLGRRK